MKTPGKEPTACVTLSPPTEGSSVQVYHDNQKVAFTTFSGNGNSVENNVHYSSESRNSMMDWSSQIYSGPEDHESLTESSTLTFVDGHQMEDSGDNHITPGLTMVYHKEFVLIDDDDDGDMSLREKTVTDVSAMDRRAAELVCGRLLSTSSDSVSESKDGPEAPLPPPPPQDTKQYCCSCTLL